MTPFGKTVARELRSALVPIETTSIVDYKYLARAMRALIHNALFYVQPSATIEQARMRVIAGADALAETIHDVGVQTKGISLEIDRARADAIVALEGLIDAVADAEPTIAGRYLGVA